ncbi:BMP family ABC transporter substrate-binding protein [Mycetocola spongiae]|uniref:BMP family ABC transporter substrate-binding protein n=1 Tax=Mycetocola spongiae TaxID=2859226 RepID=UPI001CF1F491|nr:BMP family ABC transporter substrate-binding protein [Mycetocola spongiae]UCR88559.1 BMP family ABC transporter substrate-binding protein [Mycetocola spongiae]
MKRRTSLLALLAVPVLGVLVGCSASAEPGTPDSANATVKVAVVLGGVATDGGFNQYAADAVHNLEKSENLDIQIRESVVNPSDAEPIFRQFAAEGFDLVIGWGLGFSDSILKVGQELPDTHFIATGGADILEKSTANVETWTYATDEAGYLTGWFAGKTGLSPIAVVDGELAPFNEISYRYTSLGITDANPAAVELKPIFTGNWEDAQLAAQATKAQADLGAKLIITAGEGFTPGVISAAKTAGIATIGASNASTADAAEVNVGLVKLDFTPTLTEALARLKAGKFGNHSYTSTIANKGLLLGDVNTVAAAPDVPADLDEQVAALAASLADGSFTLPELKK